MKQGHWIEFLLWVFIWTVETLIIKFAFGVESWLLSVVLAVTAGSFAIWVIKHIPDLLD